MNLKIKACVGALIVGLCSGAQAELVWEKTEIELKPAFGDEEAVAQFKYENKGDKPVKVKSVRSSCGCTVASMKKNEVAPGEKGEITATFKIGNRTGLQQKTVTVETDDPARPVTNLMLKAAIPQGVEIMPKFVYWETGEEPKPKTLTVKPGSGIAIKNLAVKSSSPEFTTKVEAGSAPGEFQIVVQPQQTARPVSGTLNIKLDLPNMPGKTFFALAKVIGASAATR